MKSKNNRTRISKAQTRKINKNINLQNKKLHNRNPRDSARSPNVLLRNRAPWTDGRLRRRRWRSQTQPHYSYPAKQGLKGDADFRTKIAAKQIKAQRIKGVDVLIKAFRREIGVTLENVNDNRTPCDYIPMLRVFVEADKASNDVGAESRDKLATITFYVVRRNTHGISAASVSARLFLRSSLSSLYMRCRI